MPEFILLPRPDRIIVEIVDSVCGLKELLSQLVLDLRFAPRLFSAKSYSRAAVLLKAASTRIIWSYGLA